MLSIKNQLAVATVVLSCNFNAPAFAQGMGGGEPERVIENVTGDLYRFRQNRHIGMFLVTPDGIIVVDPTFPEMAAWVKEQLDERFGLPVKYVIYSHSHNDHAGGGDVFADTATFIGHENMRANLQRPADDAPL
jgi:glyoxylase-like metal-dependent hydrolase (beta-lactamase superfamily II)